MDLDELLRQKAELDRQIALYQNEARSEAIAEIRILMVQNGLTTSDIAETAKKSAKSAARVGKPVAPKYKDNQGNSWTGRGLRPRWLTAALASGRSAAEFAV